MKLTISLLTLSPVRPAHSIAGTRFSSDAPSREGQDFALRLLRNLPPLLRELQTLKKREAAEFKATCDAIPWWNILMKLQGYSMLKNFEAPKPIDDLIPVYKIQRRGGRSEAETEEALRWLEKQKWVSLQYCYLDPNGGSELWGARLTEAGKTYVNANS
jgi:hypothetical protein